MSIKGDEPANAPRGNGALGALLDDDEMYRKNQLIEDSTASIYVCDAEDYSLLYVNKRAASMCGRSVEDARHMPCHQYIHGLDKPCENCYILTANDKDYTERVYT